MSDATLALAALAARLATVAPVRTGRSALETTSADLPVITIWSTGDQAAADQGYGLYRQYTRSAMLELKIVAVDAYEVALDTGLSGMRQALTEELIDGALLGGYATALRDGGARFFAPADGSEIAVVQLAFEFDYLERFT